MVNVLGLDFGSPVPSSMMILEICLLCDWQALLLTKMVRLNQNLHLLPHQRQGQCSTPTSNGWGVIVYVQIQKSCEWKYFFFKLFLSLCILIYIWHISISLYITIYITIYIYIHIYNYIYISPSFGLWEIFMHSLQRRLWSYALRTFITIRMCQLKCSTGNNDSWKAL